MVTEVRDSDTAPAEAALIDGVARTLTSCNYTPWSFGDSVAFEGMVALARQGHPELEAFVQGFARGWAATRTEFRALDCTAPGAALCEVAKRSGDVQLRDLLLELARFLCSRPRLGGVFRTWDRSPLREPWGPDGLTAEERALLDDPGPGVFVDCLHFDPPFFAGLAGLVGDSEWLRVAAEQALGYVRLLQDPATGLFHHFVLERTGRQHILGWGRGQGWALLGLLDVVTALDVGSERTQLADAAAELVRAMLSTQRADGHWDAVVDVERSAHDGSSSPTDPEPSTAAFMAVGFARAARAGIVHPSLVHDAIARARAAVLADVTRDGVLRGVSAAVWASTSTSHYRHTPRGGPLPWGQGPLALLLAEGSVAA